MKYDQIKKMLEKYKAPFKPYGAFGTGTINTMLVIDDEGESVCETTSYSEAELIAFCLNFTAQSFSVIGEN